MLRCGRKTHPACGPEMQFTERLSRTFSVLNFFTALAKSNLTYVFLALVRSSVHHPAHQGINYLPSSRTHIAKPPQSGPAAGISFCLIIVRLGHVLPEPQDETWCTSIRTPAPRRSVSTRVAVLFPQVHVQRDVYMSGSKGFSTGTLESRNQGSVDSSGDLPKVARASPSPPTQL